MKLHKHCLADQCEEAATEDIIAAFSALPRWVKLREAAKAVEAFSNPPNVHTNSERVSHLDVAANLRAIAGRLEREDAEETKREAEIEEISQLIYKADGGGEWERSVFRSNYRKKARAIFNAGYRKQANDGPR